MSKRELVDQIYNLCLEINGLGVRTAGLTNLPTVFFEFRGHIGAVCVQIHLKGWEPESEPDYHLYLYLEDSMYMEKLFLNVIDILTKIKDEMSCS